MWAVVSLLTGYISVLLGGCSIDDSYMGHMQSLLSGLHAILIKWVFRWIKRFQCPSYWSLKLVAGNTVMFGVLGDREEAVIDG